MSLVAREMAPNKAFQRTVLALRLLVSLILVLCVGDCVRKDSGALAPEHMTLVGQALGHPMTERPLNGSVGICLPDRTDPPVRFLQQFSERQFSVAPCPFWENSFLQVRAR